MVCGVIGHRLFNKREYSDKLEEVIRKLVFDYGVNDFLFGSKSEFANEAAKIVEEVQESCNLVQMIAYLLPRETRYLKEDKARAEILSDEMYEATGKKFKPVLYDMIYSEKDFMIGKASYIKRDRKIVDDSDILLFFYQNNVVYNRFKRTRSGTSLAYEYAKKKGKTIINIAEN